MNCQKMTYVFLVVSFCCSGIFAQDARTALESLSLDFAERLIRDGADEAKITELSQNLSEADLAHLSEYRELNALMEKTWKIKKNRELIAKKAESFSLEEKEDLYVSHSVENSAWPLNLLPLPGFLPGLGVGSFRQGDVAGGFMQCLGCVAFTILTCKGASEHGDTEDRYMAAACTIFIATPVLVGTLRPLYFNRTRNSYLRSSLGLDANEKFVAENKDRSDVQIALAPLLNPVANRYGAVAMIRY